MAGGGAGRILLLERVRDEAARREAMVCNVGDGVHFRRVKSRAVVRKNIRIKMRFFSC